MSRSFTSDVVVVGAGPAGSVTAMLLARAGHDVLLLDRRAFPRPKPCGDCISPGANGLLQRLGLLDDVLAEQPARLRGWKLFGPRGSCTSTGFADVALADPLATESLAIPRERFDRRLLDAALAAGARFLAPVHVSDLYRDSDGTPGVAGRRGDGSRFTCAARLVVGADGLRSIVARRIAALARKPRVRKVSLTAHVQGVLDIEPRGEMHFGSGYCIGVAPVDVGLQTCNVTLVVGRERGREVARGATGFFRDTVTSAPGLRDRLPQLHNGPVPALLGSGPFDWQTRHVAANGVALVGDAAGYFDPLSGQGIFQAIAGAIALAECASDALRETAHPQNGPVGTRNCFLTSRQLRPYVHAHNRLVRGTRRVQRLLDYVTSRPPLVDWALDRLARAPRAAATLTGVTGDVLPPRALLSPPTLISFAVPRSLTRRAQWTAQSTSRSLKDSHDDR